MKTMISKFKSTCATCACEIRKGAAIKYDQSTRKAHHAGCVNVEGNDKSASHEDWCCSDTAYEDACASACGF